MTTLASSLPETLGRYRLQEEIGRGSVGRVYAAYDPNIGRRVALKVLIPPAAADETSSAVLRDRFVAEARAVGALDHPGIVVVHDADVDPEHDLAYIAMELLEGESLATLLESGRLPVERSCAIVAQVAEALGYAHERGVVHRDIKPANILIANDGRVKLADFGVAKVVEASHTVTGQIFGSPAYMSPEQVRAEVVDGRSDLFSLGVVLYECLYGARPFRGESMAAVMHHICEAEPVFTRDQAVGISPALRAVTAMALSKDRAERFSTGADMAEALRTAQRTMASADTRPVEPSKRVARVAGPETVEPPRSRPRFLRWLFIVVLVAVLTALGLELSSNASAPSVEVPVEAPVEVLDGEDELAPTAGTTSYFESRAAGSSVDSSSEGSGTVEASSQAPRVGEANAVRVAERPGSPTRESETSPSAGSAPRPPDPASADPVSAEPASAEPTRPVVGAPVTAAAKLVVLHQNRLKSAHMTIHVDGRTVWDRRMTSGGGLISRARGDLVRATLDVEPGRRAIEVNIRGSKGRVDAGAASTAQFSENDTRYLRVKLFPLVDRLALHWEN